MRNVAAQVLGIALLVLGTQGGIRLMVNHANAGLLSWLPGGFAVQLACYVAIAALGAVLASRGKRQSDRTENDE